MSLNKCFCYVILCFCSLALARVPHTTKVELTQERRPELGWVVTCTWELAPNDRLQSVFLHRDGMQFVHYKPDFYGAYLHHAYNRMSDVMELTCDEKAANCTIIVEVVQPPPKEMSFTCEVSGEGPMFRLGNKTLIINTDVPPSDAVIEVSKANEDSNLEPNGGGKPLLNCSSTGVPAPKIVWTVGEENSEITSFHSSRVWNATSKLWYSWSTVMATDQLPIRCTPKVARGSNIYLGRTAEYNSASRIGLLGFPHILVIFLAYIS